MKIGLGTAALGRPLYINLRSESSSFINLKKFKENSFSVLEEAYKLGIRYFDTAPGYGLAENLLIEWLATKNDSSIKIATKWGYTYVANFDANAKIHEIKEHSLAKLNEQWKISNALLPHLSVYQIHSATLETGVLKNSAILNQLALLKKEFNIKIGLTTTGTNQVEVLKKALDVEIEQTQLFDAFQCTYNILDQSLLSVKQQLKNEQKTLIIKEALANGRLLTNKKHSQYNDLYFLLKKLALKYNVGIDAIALQFCLTTIKPDIVLSGVSNNIQLQQNLKANKIIFTTKEIERLTSFSITTNLYWQERKNLQWN